MNSEKLNKNLIAAIKGKLKNEAEQASLANELMDMLSIGKEAIYWRLRSEAPFTFSEAARIAKKLGISLDSVVDTTLSQNISLELIPNRYSNPQEVYYHMLEEYFDVLKSARGYSESELVYASNIFPQFPGFLYDNLTKFYSFKWDYQHNESEEVVPHHKVIVSSKLVEVRKETIRETMNIRRTCYIWDAVIFSGIVNDIKYFESIGFLKKEDIKILKDELMLLIRDIEVIATRGMFETGNKVQVYISNTHFDATYSYLNTPKYKLSLIGIFALNFVNSLDERTFAKMKSWTQSLKKLSTLRLLPMSWSGFVMMRTCGICCRRRKNKMIRAAICGSIT
ncbi:MAG: hypothetical protein LBG19_06945 [Prevotellaceae bacterium]|jgi:antitoxin component of RelBE/YafQ-DinJ toxin-antitoxin module|nr:hypothetical protein [Prevotellaceae bacterium]